MAYSILSPVSSINNDDSTMGEENWNLHKRSWQPLTYYKEPVSRFCRLNLWMTMLSLLHLTFKLSLLLGGFSPHQATDVSTFRTHFVLNYGFASLDHYYDTLWEELVPTDNYICSSEGITEGEDLHGKLSMFHQLQCVRTLRSALQDTHEGKDIGVDTDKDWAWPHCIDYLAQMIPWSYQNYTTVVGEDWFMAIKNFDSVRYCNHYMIASML